MIKFVLKKISPESAETNGAILSEYVFEGEFLTIGSDATSTIILDEAAPEQAVVLREGDQLTLVNSSEGTAINDRKLRREAMEPLALGDEIKIGDYIIAVVARDAINGNQQTRPIVAVESEPIPAPTAENFASQEKIPDPISELPPEKPKRNFADVLNALRTEEDSFYFIVNNGANAEEETRLPLEQAEMPLGLTAKGQFSAEANEINALYAIVRKNWSGIVVEAQRGGAVFVNDEAIKTVVRLRNGDRLTFNGARKNIRQTPFLELHEPSSLVALESILETRARSEKSHHTFGSSNNIAANVAAEDVHAARVPLDERRFFGYFSFFEIAAMIIGTLIAAVLIFLLLELLI